MIQIAFFENILKGDRIFCTNNDTLHKDEIAFLEKGLKECRTFSPRKLDYIIMSPAYTHIAILDTLGTLV